MRKSGKIGIALACSAWLWTGAAATDGFQLNEVVVTATRSEEQAFKANANVSVVSKEKLEKTSLYEFAGCIAGCAGSNHCGLWQHGGSV